MSNEFNDRSSNCHLDIVEMQRQYNRAMIGQFNATNRAFIDAGMQNAFVPPEIKRQRAAQQIAADVRARHPEMQVRKITP